MTDAPAVHHAGERVLLEAFVDEHRALLRATLDGLTEEQARRRLVPSATTLLGLLQHATFVERVWFAEAVTGRPRTELGIVAGPEQSFVLAADATVAGVLREHEAACAASREAVAGLGPEDVLPGNRRGPLPLRWVLAHVLREYAQHCGHADILREQVLAADGTA
ncbi:DinB family protein [Phycicoccus flavus]|uniref:DinB family protein n=1 Tax=Phycicoccus flavus TaxID=2502783 RepID=UPI000FEBB564|nr:DinB family protein [Phycicoccus flavus]NHA69640.1 DinB family protein [Phycicoccus flavus]